MTNFFLSLSLSLSLSLFHISLFHVYRANTDQRFGTLRRDDVVHQSMKLRI